MSEQGKSGRRDPFALIGGEPAASLPGPEPKGRRNRQWEEEQRRGAYCQVSYRAMPVEVRDQVRAVAAELYVSADQVARAFLEYAAAAYARGDLVLEPVLDAGKLTLYPEQP